MGSTLKIDQQQQVIIVDADEMHIILSEFSLLAEARVYAYFSNPQDCVYNLLPFSV